MNWIKDIWVRNPSGGKTGKQEDKSPMLNGKDRILQELLPTVMVPAFGLLPGLNEETIRFLMAQSGLWLEAKPAWGHFRYPLWYSARPLPYGEIESLTSLISGPISKEVISLCREEATEKAARQKEWAGWILWSKASGYHYLPLEILEESQTSVKYRRPKLLNQTHLVMDLHSHPFDLPQFSHTDDLDDLGGIHYSGVFSFDKTSRATLTTRLCIEGYYFK